MKYRICQLINDLLTAPEHFTQHIKRTTASVATIVLYGNRAKTYESFWGTVSIVAVAVI